MSSKIFLFYLILSKLSKNLPGYSDKVVSIIGQTYAEDGCEDGV